MAGLLIDAAETDEPIRNNTSDNNVLTVDGNSHGYHSIIYLYFGLRLLTSLCILKLSLDFKPPAKKILQHIRKVICRLDVISYFVAFLIAGVMWGFLESFLFWYMEDLGASKFLLGMSLGIGTLAGVPLTIFSHLLLKNLGL